VDSGHGLQHLVASSDLFGRLAPTTVITGPPSFTGRGFLLSVTSTATADVRFRDETLDHCDRSCRFWTRRRRGPTSAVAAQASSSHTSSPSCTSLQTKANKASKAGKTKKAKKLKKQYRACQKTRANELSVVKEISGYTFTGTRGDGRSMNLTFCPTANGSVTNVTRDMPTKAAPGSCVTCPTAAARSG
jgi:hypothetical protein